MGRFVEGEDRRHGVLLPEYLDDYVSEENPVRVIDVFVDELDLAALGFEGVAPEATGRPGYHPGLMLKIYVYGYINQITSSRRLEREAQRNVEMMWLSRRLAPDFKTIADFRKDNGVAIRAACRRFVELCRKLELFTLAVAAIDSSKFKAVNSRDRNFTRNSIKRRMEQVDKSIARYLAAVETADRQEGELACEPLGVTPYMPRPLTSGAKAKGRFGKQDFVYGAEDDTYRCPAGETLTRRFTTVEDGMKLDVYWTTRCADCPLRSQCTSSQQPRRIKRWEHEAVIDAMQDRLDRRPDAMRVRRATVEHVFGTLKAWMGAVHFKMRTLDKVKTEMSLHVLAYNLKRVIAILGPGPLMAAMRA